MDDNLMHLPVLLIFKLNFWVFIAFILRGPFFKFNSPPIRI
jgi:hypothetical protein